MVKRYYGTDIEVSQLPDWHIKLLEDYERIYDDDLSLCPHCYCMTKTIDTSNFMKLCGKCHKNKKMKV